VVIAVPAMLVVFIMSPRTRYFGNTAPLLTALLCTVLGLATPHFPGLGLRLLAVQNDQHRPPVGGRRFQMPRWINVNGHDVDILDVDRLA